MLWVEATGLPPHLQKRIQTNFFSRTRVARDSQSEVVHSYAIAIVQLTEGALFSAPQGQYKFVGFGHGLSARQLFYIYYGVCAPLDFLELDHGKNYRRGALRKSNRCAAA